MQFILSNYYTNRNQFYFLVVGWENSLLVTSELLPVYIQSCQTNTINLNCNCRWMKPHAKYIYLCTFICYWSDKIYLIGNFNSEILINHSQTISKTTSLKYPTREIQINEKRKKNDTLRRAFVWSWFWLSIVKLSKYW